MDRPTHGACPLERRSEGRRVVGVDRSPTSANFHRVLAILGQHRSTSARVGQRWSASGKLQPNLVELWPTLADELVQRARGGVPRHHLRLRAHLHHTVLTMCCRFRPTLGLALRSRSGAGGASSSSERLRTRHCEGAQRCEKPVAPCGNGCVGHQVERGGDRVDREASDVVVALDLSMLQRHSAEATPHILAAKSEFVFGASARY